MKNARPKSGVFLADCSADKLLLVGGGSGSSFSGLCISSGSSGRGSGFRSGRSCGSSSRSGGSSSGSFSSRSGGFFFFAASGHGQSNEGSNEEGLFHLITFIDKDNVQARLSGVR